MRRRRTLSAADIEAWRHVAASFRPLPGRVIPDARPKEPSKPPEPIPGTPVMPPPEPKSPVRRSLPAPLAAIETKLRQRVARGQIAIDARLDLHGLHQDAAHRKLFAFLQEAQRRGHVLVLVITGKGYAGASTGEDGYERERGVLRRATPLWLSAPEARPLVVGYEEAATHHGGSGALYVRIRRPRG